MNTFETFKRQLYNVNENTFDDIALDLFRFQATNNIVYQRYLNNLRIEIDKIRTVSQIPFLPISFFKTQHVKTGSWTQETHFTSSGTTGSTTSTHLIKDLNFYHEHAVRCFEHRFGNITEYHFLALLPSYLERSNSSLVSMIDYFIRRSGSESSGFYLNNTDQLMADLIKLGDGTRKVVLWGVAFALLDVVERFQPDLEHCMVFETGGMKGRRKEVTREELHRTLCKGLNVSKIYSEYGMTELLSQAYTEGGAIFSCPPWMKIIGRDVTDPFEKGLQNQTCGINVIDLANWHSISFIETEDLGKCYRDGTFEILGRLDNSEVRGCNLMVE